MKKHIPYAKLSKKGKRAADARERRSFADYGCLSPATRIVTDKKKEQNRRQCRQNTD